MIGAKICNHSDGKQAVSRPNVSRAGKRPCLVRHGRQKPRARARRSGGATRSRPAGRFPPEVGPRAYNRSAPLLRIYGTNLADAFSAGLAFETALIVLLFQLDFRSRRAVESAAILSFEVNHGLAAASCDRARFGGDHRRHVHRPTILNPRTASTF
jgi:hypothetical protein